jgi:large subunit ribosomal protein L15
MMIHEITKLVGKHKKRKRVGRGIGSGHGKTAGRGTKGMGSRSGYGGSVSPLFEGGQLEYFRRIPKRGFSNYHFRTEYNIVNLGVIEANFESGATVDAAALERAGLIKHSKLPLKVLGNGELSKKVTVAAAKFSASARQKIESAGGSCQVL